MSYVMLHELPEDHPARHKTLAGLDAECRNLQGKAWRPVKTWKIGKARFADLSGPWIQCSEFRVRHDQL